MLTAVILVVLQKEPNNLTITIRAVQRNDHTQWKSFFNDYADFYRVTTSAHCKEQVWNWIFDEQEPFWCDLAINVGFTQYQLMRRSLAGSTVCYLSDLFVNPEQRKSGAGRALIDHVLSYAKNNGIENVRWLTQDSNTTAKSLYDTYVAQSEFVLYSVPVTSN